MSTIARAIAVVGSLCALMRNRLGLNVATPLGAQELSGTIAPDRRLVVLGHDPIAGFARDHGTVADQAAMLALHTLDSATLLAEPTFVAPGDSCLRADDPGWRWHCIAGHGTALADWERRPLGGALEGLAVSGHTHAISAVTGLQPALDGKQAGLANAAALARISAEPTGPLLWDGVEIGGGTGGSGVTAITLPSMGVVGSVGVEISRAGWVAGPGCTNPGAFGYAIDGNASTRWDSGSRQIGDTFCVDFGAAQLVSRVILDTTGSSGDYPTQWAVDASVDGIVWSTIGWYPGSTVAVITFPLPVTARYIRVVITAGESSSWWSIHEFRAYGGSISVPPSTETEQTHSAISALVGGAMTSPVQLVTRAADGRVVVGVFGTSAAAVVVVETGGYSAVVASTPVATSAGRRPRIALSVIPLPDGLLVGASVDAASAWGYAPGELTRPWSAGALIPSGVSLLLPHSYG